jgi:hypothetical protein
VVTAGGGGNWGEGVGDRASAEEKGSGVFTAK